MNEYEYIDLEIERAMIEKHQSRPDCKNPKCGGHGDGWGSLGGFCVMCKHDADVGCKCILNDCGKKYWSKTMAEKKLANARGRQA